MHVELLEYLYRQGKIPSGAQVDSTVSLLRFIRSRGLRRGTRRWRSCSSSAIVGGAQTTTTGTDGVLQFVILSFEAVADQPYSQAGRPPVCV